mmetsp:Transcript_28771/g.72404  ORF Transcript_28771/g.72404 Transcript_28771/m.72404 type:complete len:228 (-) Transcript_28771:248-931(-)|eukprot:CAMPEP_0177628324 /NCGR_PEP_ID=MMETSP0447-20121125/71_1 /TAXON_ID=0 /ORGANISM="Stygamoeba regulata, Strain BSH-02190019" /LENGTH=227 /DNA_ID=CAMNT_0019129565 /DNA_START=139 /DNA_END=822 /DNA_ORIENTATION=+
MIQALAHLEKSDCPTKSESLHAYQNKLMNGYRKKIRALEYSKEVASTHSPVCKRVFYKFRTANKWQEVLSAFEDIQNAFKISESRFFAHQLDDSPQLDKMGRISSSSIQDLRDEDLEVLINLQDKVEGYIEQLVEEANDFDKWKDEAARLPTVEKVDGVFNFVAQAIELMHRFYLQTNGRQVMSNLFQNITAIQDTIYDTRALNESLPKAITDNSSVGPAAVEIEDQ